ncbi:MAG: ABC transporter ATP-binding protein [Candidatus Binatia bacterium]
MDQIMPSIAAVPTEQPSRSAPPLGVEVEGLAKRYGEVEAVRGISFCIEEGEIFGLLGPNGAGKTTTLSMLSTLLRPSRGDARIFGKSLAGDVAGVRRLVGLVPQDISLYPTLSARQNLSFFGRIYGVTRQALRARAEQLLDLVDLRGRADEPVDTYSGGMMRRLNLACGLIHAPRLLLLDEPTVGVDPESRQHILSAIRELAKDGMAVLYTTHYMEEAEHFCDRIAIMDQGHIAATGTLPELLSIVGMGELIELDWVPDDVYRARLQAVRGVTRIETTAGLTRIFVANAGRTLGPIAAVLAECSGAVEGLRVHRVNLERVFLHLTGKARRD